MEIAPSTPAVRTRKVRVPKPAEPESGTQVSAKAKAKAKAEVTPEPKAAPAKRRSVSKAGSKSTSPPSIQSVTSAPDAATLQHMIATAAYFMAEQRGFMPGHEVEDWLLAEQLVLGTVRH